jgi:hypothetical protein
MRAHAARGIDELVLAHAGKAAKRFGYDGGGEMVVIAGEILDCNLRIRKRGFQQGFDVTGRHSHYVSPSCEPGREKSFVSIAQRS